MAGERILIFEQHDDMAELMAARLGRQNYQVDVASDGAEGLKLARAIRPDLLVVDATLSKPIGRAMLEQVRSDPATTDVPILVLTDEQSQGEQAGTWIGAAEHMAKPFSLSTVVGRVSDMLRPGGPRRGSVRQLIAGPIRLDLDTYRAKVHDQSVSLTLTEFRLLAAIVSAGGKVLTRHELIAEAIGEDAVVTSRTVDVHIAALRRKLRKARNHIETVRGVGYRLATEV